MRLGFFGGSFDPPHCGHLAIARAAVQHFALDRLLLTPTGRQPLKKAGAEASFVDRLAMCRLLCEGEDGMEPSDVDAPHGDGAPNYTVHSLRTLQERYPEATIFAILGADSLPELPRWYEADYLFALATWIGVSRPGHRLQDSLSPALQRQRDAGRLRLLEGVEIPVSSTEIRRKLHEAVDPSTAELPATVLRYIHAHELYPPARGGGEDYPRR